MTEIDSDSDSAISLIPFEVYLKLTGQTQDVLAQKVGLVQGAIGAMKSKGRYCYVRQDSELLSMYELRRIKYGACEFSRERWIKIPA